MCCSVQNVPHSAYEDNCIDITNNNCWEYALNALLIAKIYTVLQKKILWHIRMSNTCAYVNVFKFPMAMLNRNKI